MDPDLDTDPALFVSDFQDANKREVFFSLICSLLSVGSFTSVFKDKELLNSRNQGFS
jgi:hypothetical protein